MPVSGPSYSDEEVEAVYLKVMQTLKENGIQNCPTVNQMNFNSDRNARNKQLRDAIEKLVELQCWEDF